LPTKLLEHAREPRPEKSNLRARNPVEALRDLDGEGVSADSVATQCAMAGLEEHVGSGTRFADAKF